MPRVVDYSQVLSQLTADGLECHYFNGGAFGFSSGGIIRGWISGPDQTIRPEVSDSIRIVPEKKLEDLAIRAWGELLGGNAWIMPGSSWSYELKYGSRNWLSGFLKSIGIDSKNLDNRTDAAAIEFGPEESAACGRFVSGLLQKLAGSDFTLAFPGRKTVCTIHHHRQLWWVMRDPDIASKLDELISGQRTHSVGPLDAGQPNT
jgi:hypothetical protein